MARSFREGSLAKLFISVVIVILLLPISNVSGSNSDFDSATTLVSGITQDGLIEGSDEKLMIATTRPETILGDSAICVNPNDERYTHLKGKKAIVPLVNRVIPIIFDEYVDMEFGTGALKITPAHDINDYKLGDKHGLESIDILNDDGTLSEEAKLYIGKDRFVVREEIAVDLKAKGYLVKTEEYQNKVGYS